jgi:hypothetical protein
MFGTLRVLKCHRCELNFLYDLHHGHAVDEQTYLLKMFKSTIDGGLWGDFIAMFWISKYLQHLIYVWSKNNGQIMVKVEYQYDVSILNIVYANNHFEPLNISNNNFNEHDKLTIQRFQMKNEENHVGMNVPKIYKYNESNYMIQKFQMNEKTNNSNQIATK